MHIIIGVLCVAFLILLCLQFYYRGKRNAYKDALKSLNKLEEDRT